MTDNLNVQPGKSESDLNELKTKADGIIKFDFTAPIKDIRKDKYNSTKTLNPKSQADKDKYFKIYEKYITSHLTEKQLAEEYDYTLYHISRIIKWVTFEIGDIDPDAQLRVMIDKLKMRQQTQELELKSAKTTSDKTKVWKAMLQIDRLLSQLEGLLSTALIDMSDKRQVNVLMNDNFQRRSGTDPVEESDRQQAPGDGHEDGQVSTNAHNNMDDLQSGPGTNEKVVDVDSVVMDDDFKRRVGSK